MPRVIARGRRGGYVARVPYQIPKIEPLAPKRRAEPFDHADWVVDLKSDGFRGVFYAKPGAPALFLSKNNYPLAQFGSFAQRLRPEIRADAAILDGEVVAPDATGRPIFKHLPEDRSLRPGPRRSGVCARDREALWEGPGRGQSHSAARLSRA